MESDRRGTAEKHPQGTEGEEGGDVESEAEENKTLE